jgi:hypothetical protein
MDQRVLKSKNLDARERTLLLEARNVAVTPKALDTLIALVRSQPKVMSKEGAQESGVDRNGAQVRLSLCRRCHPSGRGCSGEGDCAGRFTLSAAVDGRLSS